MNKLIKLSDQHYVVVDDSEKKIGDWIIDIKNVKFPRQIKTNHLLEDLYESEKKITHSTQPLNESTQPNTEFYWNTINKLSLSEVEELVSGYSAYNHKAEEQIRRIKESGEYISDLMMQSIMPRTEWDIEFDEQGKIKLI